MKTKIAKNGRIVIPTQLRKELKLNDEQEVEVTKVGGNIVIIPGKCIICGIGERTKIGICKDCIDYIKSNKLI